MFARRWNALLVGLTFVVSCTSPTSDPAAEASEPSSSTVQPAPAVPSGSQPVLTVGTFDWNHPALWAPRDFHQIVLYGDGTLVRFVLASPTHMTSITTTVPPEQVSALVGLADAAGLGEGTALPVEPSPYEVMDGAWTVITRRSDKGIGRIVVDQIGVVTEESSARRVALAELISALPSSDNLPRVPIVRWAVESWEPLSEITPDDWSWPDLDPGSLTWEFNEAGVRCAIVTKPDWGYTDDEKSAPRQVFRRPLLPSESSCDDVFAWRAVLGFEDHVTSVPEGLSPPPP